MIFISVDLPAPFSPTSTLTAPLRISRSTAFTAIVPGYTLVAPRREDDFVIGFMAGRLRS